MGIVPIFIASARSFRDTSSLPFPSFTSGSSPSSSLHTLAQDHSLPASCRDLYTQLLIAFTPGCVRRPTQIPHRAVKGPQLKYRQNVRRSRCAALCAARGLQWNFHDRRRLPHRRPQCLLQCGGHCLDDHCNSFGVAHDSWCWFLLLWPCPTQVCPLSHLAFDGSHRFDFLPMVLLGLLARLLSHCRQIHWRHGKLWASQSPRRALRWLLQDSRPPVLYIPGNVR